MAGVAGNAAHIVAAAAAVVVVADAAFWEAATVGRGWWAEALCEG